MKPVLTENSLPCVLSSAAFATPEIYNLFYILKKKKLITTLSSMMKPLWNALVHECSGGVEVMMIHMFSSCLSSNTNFDASLA